MKKVVFLLALIGLLDVNIYGKTMLSRKNKITYICKLVSGNKYYLETIRVKTTITWTPSDEKVIIAFIKKEEMEKISNEEFDSINYSVSDSPIVEIYEGNPDLSTRNGKLFYYNKKGVLSDGTLYKINGKLKKKRNGKGYAYDIDIRIVKHTKELFSFADMDYIISIGTYNTNENSVKQALTGQDKLLPMSAKCIMDDSNRIYYRKIIYNARRFR